MIEGINTSLATAQLLKAQISAQNAVSGQNVSAREPFVDPYTSTKVTIDSNSAVKAILQFRETTSGEVVRQYPTESQLQAFARSQEVLQASQGAEVRRAIASAQAQIDAAKRAQTPQTESAQQQPKQVITQSAPVEASTPAPKPEANVVAAQAKGQTPQTTISNPVGFSETV